MLKKLILYSALFICVDTAVSAQVPSAASLEETGEKQRRDLSIKGSKIVINPYDFRLAGNIYPAAYSDHAAIPLHVGFLCNERVSREVKDLMSFYRVDPSEQTIAWQGNTSSLAGWSSPDDGNGALLIVENNQLHYTVTNSYHFFSNANPVTVNLNTTPTLRIEVPEATIQWSVKVNDGINEIALRADATGTGVFFYNIPATTGWTGTKQFTIKIFAIHSGSVPDAYINVSDISLTSALSQRTVWQGNLSSTSAWTTIGGGVLQATSQGLKYTAGNHVRGFRTANMITADLSRTPKILLSVPDAIGQWALKIDDGSGDITIRGDARGLGVYEYDIPAATGWSGNKSFNLVFYSIGNNASYSHIVIGDVRIAGYSGMSDLKEASSFHTSWRPFDLPFEAFYEDDISVGGADFFYDTRTLVRELHFEGSARFILSGYYTGAVSFDNDSTLVISREGYAYALSSKIFKQQDFRFYSNSADLKGSMHTHAIPPPSGYWAIELDTDDLPDNSLHVAIAMKETSETVNLAALVHQALTGNNAATAYQQRENEINELLGRVPHPQDFTLTKVPSMGITSDEIKKEYYRAWVFLESNILPADGTQYPYVQMATGKPSLWDEGDEKAPFSAIWESLLGFQLYGFVDPQLAWEGFKGLMSLTDNNGLIGGESLPSRKAQTAWMLFQQTGDTASLGSVYDELERYLNWRLQYPHWIYFSSPDPNLKDAEFVFHALVDLGYMAKIANIVKTSAEVSQWNLKAQQFANDARSWFWPSATGIPYQVYNTASMNRSWGNTPWVTIAMYTDHFTGSYLQGILQRFRNDFSSTYNFYLPGVPKYPDLSYTIYGLIKQGMPDTAAIMIDAGIRDIVRAASFAEHYEETGTPYPKGVRPSLFGANTIIDLLWLKNGFQHDKGFPHAVNVFEGNRGVNNIVIKGDTLNISAENNMFSFSGSYLPADYSEELPSGAVVPIGTESEPEEEEEEQLQADFQLYPNPSNRRVYLIMENSKPQSSVLFSLYTIDGALVYTQNFGTVNSGRQQLTVAPPNTLRKGVYVYCVRSATRTWQGLLIRN